MKKEDLNCPDCGINNASDFLIAMLDLAEKKYNKPFIYNSGCRCKKHNKKVKGSETSSHLRGLAVDISCKNSRDRFLIVVSLILSGFNRLKVGETYIHADIDGAKFPNCLWLY